MTALSSDGGIPVWYWSPISDDDRTGMGWIVALMVVSLVLTASGIRMMLKRRALAVDDYILCISLVGHILQVIDLRPDAETVLLPR